MANLSLLTVEETAKRLSVCESRVRQFCLEGRLGQRIGGRWIITEEELRIFKRIPRPTGKPGHRQVLAQV